ncbi:hypothetical protein ACFWPK_15820 [Nocardia sp. NPDC058519]|uniref:hypothetical protein n=1 Tax=unclassified Nocardia TaxID=2637762 RepID=UPI00366564BA
MHEEIQGGENGQAPPIKSYDTSIHPNFPVVDLSKFKTIRDFTGDLIQANATQAAAVGIYFSSRDRPVAKKLFDHYYRVTGDDYVLEESTIESWISEDRHAYNNSAISTCPVAISDNKEAAISRAITEVDKTQNPVKVILSTDWVIVAGISNDHVQSLGRYSLASTTVVVAHPGAAGSHQIELRQQSHICDIYNFHTDADYGNMAQAAVNTMAQSEELGLAKSFLVYGSGAVHSWSGSK